MTPAALAFVGVTVLGTSFLSGIFGMAGGLILLGVLLLFMDVAPAMILFGIIQMGANGWRALLWRQHVRWQLVWRYLIGATAAFLAMRYVAFIPDKALLYIGLGLLPFAAELLPPGNRPLSTIRRRCRVDILNRSATASQVRYAVSDIDSKLLLVTDEDCCYLRYRSRKSRSVTLSQKFVRKLSRS